MANQDKLVKIAQEGFFMVEEFYPVRTRRVERYQRQPQETPVQKSFPSVWRNFQTPKTIDSNQAAKLYGGIVISDGRREFRF